jgi:hypothetical protein
VVGERDVLPGAARRFARVPDDREPGGLAQLGMLGAPVDRPQRAFAEVGDREVRDGVTTRLEEQDGVVALHHGPPVELGAHPPPQRLGVQHALRHTGHEELPVRVATQRPLLP